MKKRRHIQQILVRDIALIMLATLCLALLVAWLVLTHEAIRHSDDMMEGHLNDVMSQAGYMAENNLMQLAALPLMRKDGTVRHYEDNEQFKENASNSQCSVVDLVNDSGTVVNSSDSSHVGLSYNANPQTKAVLDEVRSTATLYKDVENWPLHVNEKLHLACMILPTANDEPEGLIVVAGFDTATSCRYLRLCLSEEAERRRIGERGYLVYCANELVALSSMEEELEGTKIEFSHDVDKMCDEKRMFEERLLNKDVFVRAMRIEKPDGPPNYLLAVYPAEEAQQSLRRTQLALIVYSLMLIAVLVFLLSRLMRHHVADRVEAVNKSLSAITEGDLSERVNVTESIEFATLSDGINATVAKLEDLIRQEALRIDEELALARTIQKTALPNVFPPFPEHRDFGLFASMDAAREVGGDFYDFFLIGDDRLAVLVADVSDKGIPSALFMMRAKASIKALAASGLAVDEVMSRANDDLCADNESGMFVTVWLGILDLHTGLMEYVHAGHCCPVLIGRDGVSFVRQVRDFIVAVQAGTPYHRQTLRLVPGDALFLYTDGITEAFSDDGQQYGSERLERTLSHAASTVLADDPNEYCREVCETVKNDVAEFANRTERSDDITMLCVRFEGTS